MEHRRDGTTGSTQPASKKKKPATRKKTTVSSSKGLNEFEQEIDLRERQLFQSLDFDNDQRVRRSDLVKALAEVGLRGDDRRLTESMTALESYVKRVEEAEEAKPETEIPRDPFCRAIRHNILLIERALQGNMVIPDFPDFCGEVRGIYESTLENRTGRAANYIPQLDLKDPEVDQFGVGICTIDGQRHAIGEGKEFFSLQSTCKPILYALALEEHGADTVHRHIGHEPSGASFNALALNNSNRPHNPMINAGAIMSSSFIMLKEKQRRQQEGQFSGIEKRGWAGTRLNYVMDRWEALCGGEKPRFSSPVYLSERQTADRNFALGYFMREKGAFPEGIDLDDVLDFYFQNCSIELNVEMMSVVAATFANGGINPLTGERVFTPETVRHCLSLMSSCGMYDYSGEFAFSIGLPAKSSVSGVLLIVIPNVMGIATWSPRLDEHGNSVRGIEFCKRLVETFNFHNYDNITGLSGKKDPRLRRIQQQAARVNELIWAASKGDLGAIQQQMWRGADLNTADYDLRTPLHLAAAEGRTNIIQFFIEEKQARGREIDINPHDRWGGTPLDDAYNHGHGHIIGLLEAAGGKRGKHGLPTMNRYTPPMANLQVDAAAINEMIWAASAGNLQEIRRLVARGYPLDVADYDFRTPLHLAAAEGHHQIVQYLLAQHAACNPLDRWGHTPLDDAIRHKRSDVATMLKQQGGKKGHLSTHKQSKAA